MTHPWCWISMWMCACLIHAGDPARIYSQMDYRLNLGGAYFDPLLESNGLGDAWPGTGSTGSDLFLVQLEQPTAALQLETFRARGLIPVAYVFPLTYVVWSTRQACDRLAGERGIRWTGYFEPGFRLLPSYRNLDSAFHAFRALVYRGAKRGDVESAMRTGGARIVGWQSIDSRWDLVRLAVKGPDLAALARIPGVFSLQPMPNDGGPRGEVAAQWLAGEVDMGGLAQPGYQAWLTQVGLSGAGVTLAVVDDGVDETHGVLAGRELPCVGEACAGATQSGHGTLVASNALGDGSGGVMDIGSFLRGLGVAPGAEYVDLLQANHEKPGGMLTLMAESVRNGASLSNNSWGASSQPLGYDMDTMLVDIGVRDADPQAPGHQPLTYVLAIDNGNGQFQSQGTPDDAKNIIAVGATEMQVLQGGQSPDADDLASVNAHGPARDNRLLPHLVAPGCWVDGATLQGMYQLRCGTSFAAPQVAGAATLFIEHYRGFSGAGDPSPAMVKAALLASAVNLEGRRDAAGQVMGPRPDNMQGWGRPDLADLLQVNTTKTYYDTPTIFQASGETWQVPMQVANPGEPVKITLVWTDAPGHGLGGATPAWNNDLDLEVVYQGQTYLGNQAGPGGWSVPGGMADFRNNSEGVWLGPMAAGNLEVRVRATNLAWDGLPDQGGLTDQDFALVATNLEEQTTFRVQADSASPSLCFPNKTQVVVGLEAFGGFSEQVSLSVDGLPANLSAQFSSPLVIPPGTATLTLTPDGPLAAGSYPLQIEGLSPSGMQNFEMVLHVFDQAPGQGEAVAPPHMMAGLPLEPEFSWNAVTQAESYRIQVAEDEAFSQLVFEVDTKGSQLLAPERLLPFQRYFWRVRAVNPCGEGTWSAVHRFRTRLVPPILLVDDDGDAPDVRGEFTATLDALGQDYDVWDTQNSTSEPALEDLEPYQFVIWFSGAATNFSDPQAGPAELSEIALASYLDQGGCLWLSAQEYLYDRGGPTHNEPNEFMRNYLGVGLGESDVDHTTVMGEGGVFGGLGNQNLTHSIPNQSDVLSPGKDGALAFSGDMGDAGVFKITKTYRTFYWGFSMTALTPAVREQALEAMLAACPLQFPPGCLNLDDLLEQASGWPNANSVLDLLSCMDQYSGKRAD